MKQQNTPTQKTKQKDQNGFVSIIVASLLMIILALIVVGFTRLMQREQRQALDRQLSRQALYAAESGVNDVIDILAQPVASRPAPYQGTEKTDCDPSTGLPNGGVLSPPAADDIAYTCDLYNQSPGALEYTVEASGSRIVLLQNSTAGSDFESFQITWGNADAANNDVTALPDCGGPAHDLLPDRGGIIPIIRLDLTKVGGTTAPGNAFVRSDMLANTDYLFLVPCDPPGPPNNYDYLTGDRGHFLQVPCNGASALQPCEINIENLIGSSAGPSDRYVARIRPVYDDSSVSIRARDASGPVSFANAQISVDVTARASDVVRRLRVSVPYSTTPPDVPEAALQAFDGICKRLDVVSAATPGAVIADSCYGGVGPTAYCELATGNTVYSPPVVFDPSLHTATFPCGPAVTACPTTPAIGSLTLPFDMSSIALAEAGGPGNEPIAIQMIDVSWSGVNLHLLRTTPDLDLAAAAGYSNFRVADDCKYRVNYTLYCGAPQASTGWPNPPDPAGICIPAQVNESFRANFYTARSSPDQCALGSLVAYFDVTDNFVGPVSSSVHTGSATVTVPAGAIPGPITCMEMVSGCVVDPLSLFLCPGQGSPTYWHDASIYLHYLEWIEEPI